MKTLEEKTGYKAPECRVQTLVPCNLVCTSVRTEPITEDDVVYEM